MKRHLSLALFLLAPMIAEGQPQVIASDSSVTTPAAHPPSTGPFVAGTTLYVLKRFTSQTPDGLHAFPVGQKVTFIRAEKGDFIVTDGTIECRASSDLFASDSSSGEKAEKAENEKRNILLRKQASLQSLELRFSLFVDEIKKLKKDQLHGPTRLFQSGSSKNEVDIFRNDIGERIQIRETRLMTLRTLISELDSRGATLEATANLLKAVYNEKVFIGMPKAFTLLSWGIPDDINRTINENGTSEQWVYRHGRFDGQYVYINDGLVTSMQD